jgi:hypothetical protein
MLIRCKHVGSRIRDDFAELFESGFQVLRSPERERPDRKDCRIRRGFVSEPEDIEAGFSIRAARLSDRLICARASKLSLYGFGISRSRQIF